MEEEKKEVAVEEVEEVKAEEAAPAPAAEEADAKNALLAFILSAIGFVGTPIPFGGVVSIVLGIIALNFLKKIQGEITRQPHRVFAKIAKPVAIVDIILGAISVILYFIFIVIVPIALAAAGAAANA